MRTSSAVTRPAAIAACALARLSNRPRSTSRRSMRIWVAMDPRWVRMHAIAPPGGGVRVPELVTVLCCYFQSAHGEPTRSGARPAPAGKERNHGTKIFPQCFEGRGAGDAQTQAREPEER